ncbi:unnamed protein product [Cylicocyclus nassatus]|uniref:Uncharacterized protein n=1 Tax=Cylicocyclus nassatus TaxID=53992 RepID=A0AA36DQ82_CYLNA|nr:unnamed protein product [Cylicocyclus nassatus]
MRASFLYLLFLVLIIIASCDKPRKRKRYEPKSCQDKAPRYCKRVKKGGCQGLIAKVACKMTCERCKAASVDNPKSSDKEGKAANSSINK